MRKILLVLSAILVACNGQDAVGEDPLLDTSLPQSLLSQAVEQEQGIVKFLRETDSIMRDATSKADVTVPQVNRLIYLLQSLDQELVSVDQSALLTRVKEWISESSQVDDLTRKDLRLVSGHVKRHEDHLSNLRTGASRALQILQGEEKDMTSVVWMSAIAAFYQEAGRIVDEVGQQPASDLVIAEADLKELPGLRENCHGSGSS